MDRKELDEILNAALDELIQRDIYLIEQDANERAITNKLCCYINNRILPRNEGGWDVDAEYNRNWGKPKALPSGNVIPDIIIHRRGENNTNRTEENNLLIIELKKNPTNNERNEDRNKIKAFIAEEPFNYCFGAFISLTYTDIAKYEIEWFEREVKTKEERE